MLTSITASISPTRLPGYSHSLEAQTSSIQNHQPSKPHPFKPLARSSIKCDREIISRQRKTRLIRPAKAFAGNHYIHLLPKNNSTSRSNLYPVEGNPDLLIHSSTTTQASIFPPAFSPAPDDLPIIPNHLIPTNTAPHPTAPSSSPLKPPDLYETANPRHAPIHNRPLSQIAKEEKKKPSHEHPSTTTLPSTFSAGGFPIDIPKERAPITLTRTGLIHQYHETVQLRLRNHGSCACVSSHSQNSQGVGEKG